MSETFNQAKWQARVDVGEMWALQGNYPAALVEFDRALGMLETGALWLTKSSILLRMGKQESAVVAARKAADLSPDDARLIAMAAHTLLMDGYVVEARDRLIHAIDTPGEWTFAALWELGRLSMRVAKYNEAKEWFRQAEGVASTTFKPIIHRDYTDAIARMN